MFFSYLASNWVYLVIVISSIIVCVLGSILKCVILKKMNKKTKVESKPSKNEGEENQTQQ